MANHIALQVMANIAAQSGFSPPVAPVAHAEAGKTAARLTQDEQAMLLRAIQGPADAKKAPRRAGVAPSNPGAVSLEELARRK